MYRVLGPSALIAVLGGCTTLQMPAQIEQQAEEVRSTTRRTLDDFGMRATDTSRTLGQSVDLPWIAGRPQPLAREVTLPRALRANVSTTMLWSDGDVDLPTLAERLQRASGILIRVEPDALLPQEEFLPRLGENRDVELAVPAPVRTAPHIVPGLTQALGRSAGPLLPSPTRAAPNTPARLPPGDYPLATVLDSIGLRLGVYWRYDADLGAIVIYRTETRSFNVRVLAQAAKTTMELGLAGSARNSGSGGGQFASQSKTEFGSDVDAPMASVIEKMTQFLSRSGRISAPPGGTNSVVVTDTVDAIRGVERFVEAENRALTRRVRLVFEEITLARDDTDQAGIDWNLIFNSAGRDNAMNLSALGSLLDTAAGGAMSLGGTIGSGQWAGSAVAIKALSDVGTVVRHTSVPLLTLNRAPVTYAVRETFSYVDQLQQTQSVSDSSSPTVTVSQQEETVGTFLTLVPDAQDDGQVLLTMAYDDTRLIAMEKQTIGTGDAASFVQQPRISGHGAVQQVELRPGQPAVVAAFEQRQDDSNNRRLDRSAPLLLGGSTVANQKQQVTVLMVTAIPEEGL